MVWTDILGPALFVSSLRMAAPLAFGALGGIFAERSGVFNIAVEGTMLMGAFCGMVVSYFTHNPWLGMLGAAAGGALITLILAILSIRFKADQTVAGVAINLLCTSLTGYLLKRIFDHAGQSPSVTKLSDWSIPILKDIPVIGPILGTHTPPVYLAIIAVFLCQFVLFKTPFGLRLRSCGEHPRAADTLGINVFKTRYIGLTLSGIFAGLGGGALSLGLLSSFVENMTAGRGYIALAAMIFGRWNPIGAACACLLFGFADALQMNAQTFGLTFIPREFLLMLPYLITMAALAGVIGKTVPPAASGKPYDAATRS